MISNITTSKPPATPVNVAKVGCYDRLWYFLFFAKSKCFTRDVIGVDIFGAEHEHENAVVYCVLHRIYF